MRYLVDIDGTICRTNGNDYKKAKPILDNISKINELYNAGHEVIYYTSRGMSSGIDWHDFTRKQLISWGCMFHDLRCDKPSFDIIVDDKAKRIEEL